MNRFLILLKGKYSYHFRLKWWGYFPSLKGRPVDGFEEGMSSNVSHNAKPTGWITLKQLGDRSRVSDKSVAGNVTNTYGGSAD